MSKKIIAIALTFLMVFTSGPSSAIQALALQKSDEQSQSHVVENENPPPPLELDDNQNTRDEVLAKTDNSESLKDLDIQDNQSVNSLADNDSTTKIDSTYIYTFLDENNNLLETLEVSENKLIEELPDEPYKQGSVFKYWYVVDDEFIGDETVEADFSIIARQDLIFKPHFEKITDDYVSEKSTKNENQKENIENVNEDVSITKKIL